MRRHSLLFTLIQLHFVLLVSNVLLAQDTVPKYRKSQAYQKARHLDWALKYESNTIVRDNDFFYNRFAAAFEKQLSKEVSINTSARLYRQNRRFFEPNFEGKRAAAWQIEAAIEPRWYYEAAEDSTRGSNFYGNYLGLKLVYEGGYRRPTPTFEVLAVVGFQRFFYANQFTNTDSHLDASLGIGLGYEKGLGVRPAFQILVVQGLVLNNFLPHYRKNNVPPDRTHENHALQDKKGLLKLDLFNLVTKADSRDWVEEVNLAYERKIGESSFSVNFQGFFTPHFFQTPSSVKSVVSTTTKGNRWGFGIEPRWYYDLNKRRAKGKSGNNLFGYYLSTEFLYQNQTIYRSFERESDNVLSNQNLTVTPMWGVQQRLSKFAFYDFRCGWGLRTVQDAERRYFGNFESAIFADVLLGVAF